MSAIEYWVRGFGLFIGLTIAQYATIGRSDSFSAGWWAETGVKALIVWSALGLPDLGSNESEK